MSNVTPILSRRGLLGLPDPPRAAERVRLAALATAAAAAPVLASTDKNDELVFMSTTKLAGLIRTKKVSAVEAVDAYIARQLIVNDRLNAVVMNCYERAPPKPRRSMRGRRAASGRGRCMACRSR